MHMKARSNQPERIRIPSLSKVCGVEVNLFIPIPRKRGIRPRTCANFFHRNRDSWHTDTAGDPSHTRHAPSPRIGFDPTAQGAHFPTVHPLSLCCPSCFTIEPSRAGHLVGAETPRTACVRSALPTKLRPISCRQSQPEPAQSWRLD